MAELSETDIARIARVVRRIEHEPYNALSDRPAGAGRSRQVDIVRVTSATPTAGRYPGKVQLYDTGALTWTDLGDVWLVDTGGTGLVLDYYPAIRYGDANGRPVFLTTIGSIVARKNSTGSDFGPRRRLNLIEGSGVTLTVADDATDNEVDVTIAASGGTVTSDHITFSGARVYHNTTQAISGGGIVLAFNTEDFDTDTYHDTSSSNSHLTIPTTGYYHFGGCVLFSMTNATGIQLYVRLNGNGATILADNNKLASSTGGVLSNSPFLVVDSIYKFTAGDYIELVATYAGGTGGTILNSAHEYPVFWIYRLGA